MKVLITGSGNKKSWYKDEIGKTFEVITPPEWTKEDLLSDVYYVDHHKNSSDIAVYVNYSDCIMVEGLPKAIEPNEQPSPTGAAAEGGNT